MRALPAVAKAMFFLRLRPENHFGALKPLFSLGQTLSPSDGHVGIFQPPNQLSKVYLSFLLVFLVSRRRPAPHTET
jgi:hypothetical protein